MQPEFTKKHNSLEHAEHNFKACILLKNNKDFSDWVVTTAFYSALHFVRHVAFPYESNFKNQDNKDIIFKDFDSYNNYLHKIKSRDAGLSAHELMIELAETVLPPDISKYYSHLFEVCMNARYSNYLIKEFAADICLQYLESIAKYARNQKKGVKE